MNFETMQFVIVNAKEFFYFLSIVLIFLYVFRMFLKKFDLITEKCLEKFDDVMDHFQTKENKKLLNNFDHVFAILSYHMDAAYETIHKDNILIYSLEGVKPSEEDINNVSKEFVKLVMELSGPNMFSLFIELYGNEDVLFFVMLDYFNRRFEDDEIRGSAIEKIQDGGEEI